MVNGFTRLIEQQYFVVDRIDALAGEVRVEFDGPGCLVGLSGSGVVRFGGEDLELKMGQAVVVPVGSGPLAVRGDGLRFMRCVAPV